MTLSNEQLREIVSELMTRPGHEKVRALLYQLLVQGLGASSSDIDFERRLPEVRGRADALLGRTVFEFKRDLRAETREAEEELSRYLREREDKTGERYVGLATDGVEFVPYELRRGKLVRLTALKPAKEKPEELLLWLGTVVSVRADLEADPEVVRRELGRESLAYEIARSRLVGLWAEAKDHPGVRVKRQLWASLLQRVYGSSVDEDELFFQHTYLTIVAKTMATRALGLELAEPVDLLAGKPFHDAGITGAGESDFFDWVLVAGGGDDLVRRISRQVARFRLHHIKHDVLKGLYESLIDPVQRHLLGEYYTPDWLAARMCARAIDNPLKQRVLDPACGSGTFLFHAVHRFLAAADAAGMSNREALTRCTQQVLGVDVHPEAVIIAQVTYLLALGEERLRERPALSIPVYLGDSLQWNTERILAAQGVRIDVPQGPSLYFPFSVTQDPTVFDAVITALLQSSEDRAEPEALQSWLELRKIGDERDRTVLLDTYRYLRKLRSEGRNHIWGYVARNLCRPIWLSSETQRPHVVVGNPPWLPYRDMSREMQEHFRRECQQRGIWAGGKLATQQDISAYFFARCAEVYLRPGATLAFVMPYSTMTRQQYRGFRTGSFGTKKNLLGSVSFVHAWAFDESVQPLFKVPSCVLFAKAGPPGPLPSKVTAFSGTLPRRDATLEEAEEALQSREVPWSEVEAAPGSPYRGSFRNGATIFPRVLFLVEKKDPGRLGVDPATPLVISRRTRLEKRPWRDLPSLEAKVEAQFLRPLYLGESVAPFRLLTPVLTVIPWDARAGQLLDGQGAQRAGYIHLGRWLRRAEELWGQHGRSDLALVDQLDYYKKLTAQMPPPPVRVLYAASGTLPAAAITTETSSLVEHALYWAEAESKTEGRYLTAILNSETVRSRIASAQAKGQWGARHFDKVIFQLPIPRFESGNGLHRELAAAAERAEQVAAGVSIPVGVRFVRARQLIREALREDGVATNIDSLVARLLGRADRRHRSRLEMPPSKRR